MCVALIGRIRLENAGVCCTYWAYKTRERIYVLYLLGV
jgi:hypothetical protein